MNPKEELTARLLIEGYNHKVIRKILKLYKWLKMVKHRLPRRTKKINDILIKLTEKEMEILTKYISRVLLFQMEELYKEQQKNNPNPLSI